LNRVVPEFYHCHYAKKAWLHKHHGIGRLRESGDYAGVMRKQYDNERIHMKNISLIESSPKRSGGVYSNRPIKPGQKLAVVVTGATGKQGGAVVKGLLERGHEVRAVTRSTDSAKARELANAGVTLVRASLEDTAALTKALEGATSLFAMTTPYEGGAQAETRQGISAADAARAAGVHLVFTSVGSADRKTARSSDSTATPRQISC
jgi:hypothetical protein